MGSLEVTNSLSSEMEAKRNCLERAKKILWTEHVSHGGSHSGPDDKSKAYIESLVNLYDDLHDNISKSLDCSELIYSEFYQLSSPTNGETIREIVKLESDLYRAMWLNCLILLPIVDASNDTKQDSRKRSREEMNHPTSDRGNKTILLQRNIDKCRFLLSLLEQLGVEAEANANNPWEERIRKLTEDIENKEEEDDDQSLNLLSFTKEQLEQEEQELLQMAGTPIPTSYTHKEQNVSSIEANDNGHCSEKLTEAQDEVQKLWAADAVVAAQNKAREIYEKKKLK